MIRVFLQDIVKELARTASLAGTSDPAPERQTSGGIAFTAGEVGQKTNVAAHEVGGSHRQVISVGFKARFSPQLQ